jgi:hypothetical protein
MPDYFREIVQIPPSHAVGLPGWFPASPSKLPWFLIGTV